MMRPYPKKWLNNFLTLWLYYIYIIIIQKNEDGFEKMGVYLKLGYNHALWMEIRKDWFMQSVRVEKFNNEWLICLPALQLVYTSA